MKLASVCLAALVKADDKDDDVWYGPKSFGPRAGGVQSGDTDRRYNDLEDMAKKYFKKSGTEKFNEQKYWAYGCHCFILGDRALSEMGMGTPKDALDNKCKAYKDCQKCVREQYGDACIGEAVRYTWKWSTRNGRLESKDDLNTCERGLFNCDAQFVADTYAEREAWNRDFHGFWSELPGGFDNRDPENCPSHANGNGGQGGPAGEGDSTDPSGGGGAYPDISLQHACCGGGQTSFLWIPVGEGHKQCCANGSVADYGQC